MVPRVRSRYKKPEDTRESVVRHQVRLEGDHKLQISSQWKLIKHHLLPLAFSQYLQGKHSYGSLLPLIGGFFILILSSSELFAWLICVSSGRADSMNFLLEPTWWQNCLSIFRPLIHLSISFMCVLLFNPLILASWKEKQVKFVDFLVNWSYWQC